MSNNSYTPESVMAIVAHPDDIEFGCAGTVVRWVNEGARAAYIMVTSGDVGIAKPGMTKAQAAEIREAESLNAAKVAGVNDVTFLREPDGMVENTMALRKKIVREIRRFQLEVVITGDPTMVFTPMGGINHPDHRAVAGATIDAVFPACGQPNLFEELADEGLQAHKVRKVYVTSRGQGDTFVDISSTVDVKVKALQQHESQVGHWTELADVLKARTAEMGRGKEMAHAEVYRVITLESDETWQKLVAAKVKEA